MSKRRRAAAREGARAARPIIAAVDTEPQAHDDVGRDRLRLLSVAAIGLSAFLLFTVELRAGKLVLPVFGGAPAVWTTALCFFTAILFAGYAYAHLIATRLGRAAGGAVHLVVASLAFLATALGPIDLAPLRDPGLPEAVNVLIVLGAIAGPTVFLLSSTSPLLSAWYSRRGRDPWWLYAASNAASLLGLLAYPLLIEPLLPLSAQRNVVLVALVVLVGLLATIVARVRAPARDDSPTAVKAGPPLIVRRQLLWLLAAAVPAGLLSATTSHLTTDLISAPLLWVGPLGIYLISLVIAFSERGRRILPTVERMVPAAATLMWISFVLPGSWPVLVLLLFLLLSYGVLAVALHGRLALDRPHERQLTRFYLIVSAGGVLATAFVALLAPVIFNSIYEYPVLIVAGLVVLAALGAGTSGRQSVTDAVVGAGLRLAPYLLVGLVLVVLVALDDPSVALDTALVFAVGALVIAIGRNPRVLAAGTAVAIVVVLVVNWPNPMTRVRTFFGVLDVRSSYFGLARSEFSGTTLHGLQFIDERRTEPTTYYVEAGPLGDVFAEVQARRPDGAVVGVVGLGVGTMAAYGRAVDTIRFVEIDQAVVDLAYDQRYFSYLAESPAATEVVVSDARLWLAGELPGTWDLLILDAFSSDAVPAHLLTREAMEIYRQTLRPGGLLAFHLSNRYYDLDPAVGSTLRAAGLDALGRRYIADPPTPEGLAPRSSIWVVGGTPDAVAPFTELDWTRPVPGPVITDDVPDLLRTLRFP